MLCSCIPLCVCVCVCTSVVRIQYWKVAFALHHMGANIVVSNTIFALYMSVRFATVCISSDAKRWICRILDHIMSNGVCKDSRKGKLGVETLVSENEFRALGRIMNTFTYETWTFVICIVFFNARWKQRKQRKCSQNVRSMNIPLDITHTHTTKLCEFTIQHSKCDSEFRTALLERGFHQNDWMSNRFYLLPLLLFQHRRCSKYIWNIWQLGLYVCVRFGVKSTSDRRKCSKVVEFQHVNCRL